MLSSIFSPFLISEATITATSALVTVFAGLKDPSGYPLIYALYSLLSAEERLAPPKEANINAANTTAVLFLNFIKPPNIQNENYYQL